MSARLTLWATALAVAALGTWILWSAATGLNWACGPSSRRREA